MMRADMRYFSVFLVVVLVACGGGDADPGERAHESRWDDVENPPDDYESAFDEVICYSDTDEYNAGNYPLAWHEEQTLRSDFSANPACVRESDGFGGTEEDCETNNAEVESPYHYESAALAEQIIEECIEEGHSHCGEMPAGYEIRDVGCVWVAVGAVDSGSVCQFEVVCAPESRWGEVSVLEWDDELEYAFETAWDATWGI